MLNIEKISFYSSEDKALSDSLRALEFAESERAFEYIEGCLSAEGEYELAFSLVGKTLIARVFELGRYFFLFPIPLSESADINLAVCECVKYCTLEQIEPIFSAVPKAEIGAFGSLGYRHINIDADTPDCSEYRVVLKNELSLSDFTGKYEGERISLSPLNESDTKAFAALCRDRETNKYMGYDWLSDYPDADDKTFLEVALREFNFDSALTLAVRLGSKTVGDVAIHNLDYKGGADVSVRILPEYRRLGYAREAFSLLLDAACDMGLVRIIARVHKDNAPSLSLFAEGASSREDLGESVVFTYELFDIGSPS